MFAYLFAVSKGAAGEPGAAGPAGPQGPMVSGFVDVKFVFCYSIFWGVFFFQLWVNFKKHFQPFDEDLQLAVAMSRGTSQVTTS